MELFRYATSVYGQKVLLGASWSLFWWFVGAAAAFIVLDIIGRAVLSAPHAPADAASDGGRVTRHLLVDRLYHWAMAASVLTLLFTAFAPILGWKFEWLTVHWCAGVVLTVLVLIHIVRASFWQDFWAMMVVPADLRLALQALRRGGVTERPGKYPLLQKLYHWAIAAIVLAMVVTGLLMLLKIDTPLWRRNPYWFADSTWGVIYAVHDLCAMATLALVAAHIYMAVRPDKFWITRSMFSGWITRRDYLAHHDPARWAASEGEDRGRA